MIKTNNALDYVNWIIFIFMVLVLLYLIYNEVHLCNLSEADFYLHTVKRFSANISKNIYCGG